MEVAIYNRIERTLENSVNSINTANNYRSAIRNFLDWLAPYQGNMTEVESVAAYKQHLKNRGLANSTINAKLAAIRKLFNIAGSLGLVDARTVVAVQEVGNIPVHGQKTGKWLPASEVKRLLSIPDNARDYAIMAVFLGTGLRISEVANLTWGNLDQVYDENSIPRWAFVNFVRKGNKTHSVRIPEEVAQAIFDYKDRGLDNEFIFTSQRGNSITTRAIYDIVKDVAAKAGIADLRPHDLRKTWTFIADKGGATLEQIQQQLGHSRPETTQRYKADMDALNNTAVDGLGIW